MNQLITILAALLLFGFVGGIVFHIAMGVVTEHRPDKIPLWLRRYLCRAGCHGPGMVVYYQSSRCDGGYRNETTCNWCREIAPKHKETS